MAKHTWGILADKHLEHVPGTALLEDVKGKLEIDPAVVGKLKHGTGRNSHIILVPQPSDDPRDPLNWPKWKREAAFWTLCYSAGIAGAVGPLLAPGYVLLAEQWNVSVQRVATVNGYLTLTLGVTMLINAPFAKKWGKRPVYLITGAILFFSSIWAAAAQSINSLLGARLLNGWGMAAYEALVMASISDLYFVHERGTRSAIWGFSIITGINVTPIVNGYVVNSAAGYRLCFWLLTAITGLALVLMLFFVPETSYERHYLPHSAANELDGSVHVDESPEKKEGEQTPATSEYLPAKTFWQELPIWSGYSSKESLLVNAFKPFPYLLSPVVWFAILTYGITICFIVVLSTTSSVVFGSPPYNFNAEQTGLVSIGPLVFSLLGTFTGPLVDWSATFFARRNHGVFEPEFRLPLLMTIMVLIEALAYMGWAFIQSSGGHWIGPVTAGSTAIVTYVLDAHQADSPETFAIINLVKNLVLFGFISFSVEWIDTLGIKDTFGSLAGLTAAVIIIPTVLMYVFGKRVRSWVARSPKLFMTGLNR